MLLAMLWQAAAMGRAGWTVAALADPVDAGLHWNLQTHQHAQGAAQLVEASAESVCHLIGDGSNQSALPTGGEHAPAAFLAHDLPAAYAVRALAPPYLEAPRRPPRSRA